MTSRGSQEQRHELSTTTSVQSRQVRLLPAYPSTSNPLVTARLTAIFPSSVLLALAAVALTQGCSPSAAPMVRVKAASDMVCPERAVRVVRSSNNAYDAYGCGKHQRYFARCQGLDCVVTKGGVPDESLQSRGHPQETPAPRQPMP